MWVTVWRHGEASPGSPDEFRPLTTRGRASVRAASRRYLQSCAERSVPAAQRIAFSPLVRTTQTAEIIAGVLDMDAEVCPALAPGANLHTAERYVDSSLTHQIIVSHQPFVSALITHWTESQAVPPLMPGGFACLKMDVAERGCGELVFAEPALF